MKRWNVTSIAKMCDKTCVGFSWPMYNCTLYCNPYTVLKIQITSIGSILLSMTAIFLDCRSFVLIHEYKFCEYKSLNGCSVHKSFSSWNIRRALSSEELCFMLFILLGYILREVGLVGARTLVLGNLLGPGKPQLVQYKKPIYIKLISCKRFWCSTQLSKV